MRRVTSGVPVACAAVLIVGVLGASPALAQNQGGSGTPGGSNQQGGSSRQEGLGIQVVGGPLFSNLTETGGIDTSNKTGFLAGLSLGGNRGGRVGVGADILYGQRGAKIVGLGDFSQQVVHVPVMLKVNIGQRSANGVSVFGLGGGYFEWQFSGKVGDVDVSNDTNGYELGYVFGGGVEVLRLSVQARYMHGLKAVDKTLTSSTDSKSQAVAILVGIRIN
jgi:hypothetical protein